MAVSIPDRIVTVSLYSFMPAQIQELGLEQNDDVGFALSKSLIATDPPICSTTELLDISGFTVTGDNGSATVLLSDFLCDDPLARHYAEPPITVANPVSETPFFVTITHKLLVTPFNDAPDVQINFFAWTPNGNPAPAVAVHWRCRVPISRTLR